LARNNFKTTLLAQFIFQAALAEFHFYETPVDFIDMTTREVDTIVR
jgi:hypothetical protein